MTEKFKFSGTIMIHDTSWALNLREHIYATGDFSGFSGAVDAGADSSEVLTFLFSSCAMRRASS